MNTTSHPLIRAAALAAALVALSVPSRAGDLALQIMAQSGSVPIAKIGADVRIGSPSKDVSEEVGHPSRILPDGTWLFYKNFYVDHSSACGTLAVSVKDGHVSAMKLVTPGVAAAMVAQRGNPADSFIASNR